MEFIYAFLYFICFCIGIYTGLKLPFISDKLGKKIIRENVPDIPKKVDTISNLTPDIISEWQNGIGDDSNE